MKLAEGLAERSDLQKRLQQVSHRAQQAARYQEGETPAEDVNALLEEGLSLTEQIQALVVRINRTNSETTVSVNGSKKAQKITLTAAIAMRDGLSMQRKLLTDVAEAAASGSHSLGSWRRSRTELIDKTDLQVAVRRAEADAKARRHRELDTIIQQANWNTDLL
jgi:hypothetical protein